MCTVVFKCPNWVFGSLVTSALVPLALLPLATEFDWPTYVKYLIVLVGFLTMLYACSLVPTRLVVSEDGLLQKEIFSDLHLRWTEITEWRCVSVAQYQDFWVRDRAGKTHHLGRWLIFGRERSRQIAELMRRKGISGREQRVA
jgi:hypothetical protein